MNTNHVITITGINDDFCDGAQMFAIVTSPSVSLDPNYDGIDPSDLSVTNHDNEGGGITVTPVDLTTTEAGAAATFQIFLNCRPMADVSVPIASSDTTEVVASSSVVTFTSQNWNSPATVTVTGVDDAIDDGNQIVPVTLGPTVSADPGFHGIMGPNVSVTNVDDD
jgi:hypothetical protein